MRPWIVRVLPALVLAWAGCAASPDRPANQVRPPAEGARDTPARTAAPAPSSASAPSQLDLVRGLVRDVPPEASRYQHNPTVVVWEAGAEGGPACRADCSGLMNEVFKRSFGLSDEELTGWLRSKRPLAMHYHNAIKERRGFERVEGIDAVRPGDVIATRYEPGAGNSGHVMIVDETPQRDRRAAHEPGEESLPPDAVLWRVRVIDSSRTGHGPGDSRFVGERRVRNGLGTGYFRVATDSRGVITAHAFGTASTDAWHPVSKRPLAIGRVTRPRPTGAWQGAGTRATAPARPGAGITVAPTALID